ncbi:hypothetical protein GCM10023155_20050 [Bremerella cremea]
MQGDADLLQLIAARHTTGRFTSLLHGGQKQGDQNSDDRDHNKKFNEREAAGPPRTFHGEYLRMMGKPKRTMDKKAGQPLVQRHSNLP